MNQPTLNLDAQEPASIAAPSLDEPVGHSPSSVHPDVMPENSPSITSITSIISNEDEVKDGGGVNDIRALGAPSSPGEGESAKNPMDVMDVMETSKTPAGDDGRVTDGQNPSTATGSGVLIGGTVRLGNMYRSRDSFKTLENPALRQLLLDPQLPNTIFEAGKGSEITIVDADCHHWKIKPTIEEAQTYLVSIVPPPDAGWVSHGRGMKLLYVGPFHCDRAMAAALSVPASFEVEILTHTRHPQSPSSSHPDKACGPVVFAESDPSLPFEFMAVGKVTSEARELALKQLGMEPNGRYDHGRCPIDPESASTAPSCVQVMESGIYCHRCASHYVRYRGCRDLSPGFLPFSAITSNTTIFSSQARHWVHWSHAQRVLKYHYPNLSLEVLRRAYRRVLESMHDKDDLRIPCVFNPDLNFVWTSFGWADEKKIEQTEVDNDAANRLPYDLYIGEDEEGEPALRVDTARRSRLKHRDPEGYIPLRPVRGLVLEGAVHDNDDSIPVVLPPAPKWPYQLLADPMPEDQAFRCLEQPFPGLISAYLKVAIAGFICSQMRRGQPPMIATTGPSGGSKEQTVRLAASFVGHENQKIDVEAKNEGFVRSIGASLAAGHGFLMLDEFGKSPNLKANLPKVLSIASAIQWRPLYSNRQVSTACTGAFFFPCVNFPEQLTSSPEFCRRVRHIRLPRKVQNWARTSGADTALWRDASRANAEVGNSIVTHVYRLCQSLDFEFSAVADALGLGSLSEYEGGIDPQLLRRLYAHARNEDGRRELLITNNGFAKGWVNLNAKVARDLISDCVPLDDGSDIKRAKEVAKTNLEAQSWNDVLGIAAPPIRCRVKIHGSLWAMRFESAEPTKKGDELVNEDLPAAATTAVTSESEEAEHGTPTPPASSSGPEPGVCASPTDEVAAAMREGGLPL